MYWVRLPSSPSAPGRRGWLCFVLHFYFYMRKVAWSLLMYATCVPQWSVKIHTKTEIEAFFSAFCGAPLIRRRKSLASRTRNRQPAWPMVAQTSKGWPFLWRHMVEIRWLFFFTMSQNGYFAPVELYNHKNSCMMVLHAIRWKKKGLYRNTIS